VRFLLLLFSAILRASAMAKDAPFKLSFASREPQQNAFAPKPAAPAHSLFTPPGYAQPRSATRARFAPHARAPDGVQQRSVTFQVRSQRPPLAAEDSGQRHSPLVNASHTSFGAHPGPDADKPAPPFAFSARAPRQDFPPPSRQPISNIDDGEGGYIGPDCHLSLISVT
jgi:hypothetical protein